MRVVCPINNSHQFHYQGEGDEPLLIHKMETDCRGEMSIDVMGGEDSRR